MVQVDPLWTAIINHADTLLRLVRDHTPKGELTVPRVQSYVMKMYWRAIRLNDGILVLLKAELPEEAAFLARSLFEESLHLQLLASEEQTRDAYILGWVNKSINENCGLLEAAKSVGLDPNIDEVLASLARERRNLQDYCRRHGIAKLRPFPSVRDLAKKYDRMHDFWTYSWAHESVHGSDAAWFFAGRKIGKNKVQLAAKTNDTITRAAFAEFAATSMANAAEATFAMFKWSMPPSVKQLSSEIRRLLEEQAA